MPLDAEGRVDEVAAAAAPPNGRVVPFDQWPTALNPGRQYVVHANNDPANITTDNDFFNEPYYIGGPWLEGYRGARIATRLEDAITNNRADMAEMARIQGDHHSNLGEEWIPVLLDTIRAARAAAAGSPAAGTSEARMAARWMAARTDYEEVERRVIAWRDAGLHTPSGVETFYSPVRAGDAENSVATTVFHAWISAYFQGVMDDEGISGDFSPAPTGDTFRTGTAAARATRSTWARSTQPRTRASSSMTCAHPSSNQAARWACSRSTGRSRISAPHRQDQALAASATAIGIRGAGAIATWFASTR
jgi:hypothetical protein